MFQDGYGHACPKSQHLRDKAGGSEVKAQPLLYIIFEASLDYRRLCLENNCVLDWRYSSFCA